METNKISPDTNKPFTTREVFQVSGAAVGAMIAYTLFHRLFPIKLKDVFERDPKVQLNFYQEYHYETYQEFKTYKELFEKADAIVFEAGRWTDESLQQRRDISEGIDGSPAKHQLGILYKSKKPVFYIDPKGNHPLWEKYFEVIEPTFNIDQTTYTIPFKERIQQLKDAFIKSADIHKERQVIWENQLSEIIRDLKTTKEFKNKNTINIMVVTGAFHTGIYHRIKKDNVKNIEAQASRTFDEIPFIYDLESEIKRRCYFLEKTPSDEDIAKYLLVRMVEIKMGGLYGYKESIEKTFENSPSKQAQFMRHLANKFSLVDIKNVLKEVRKVYLINDESEWDNHGKMKIIMEKALEEKGIELPQTSY